MFKRKKKKTGCEAPTYSRFSMAPEPTRPSKPNPNYVPPASSNFGYQPKSSDAKPPKPPTSGSNAVKPSCNCGHQPTCTSTQNPPDTFSSLLKATSVQILPNDISTVTYICTYETPCGWCAKWDKKCDKKIGLERGQRVNINPVDDAIDFSYGKCLDCKYEVGCDKECNPENSFKYFQSKEN